MAFDKDYLTLVGPAGNTKSGKVWKYKTEDTLEACDLDNYFNDAEDLLQLGDEISVVEVTNIDASNEAIANAGMLLVIDMTSGALSTTEATVYTLTDTD